MNLIMISLEIKYFNKDWLQYELINLIMIPLFTN